MCAVGTLRCRAEVPNSLRSAPYLRPCPSPCGWSPGCRVPFGYLPPYKKKCLDGREYGDKYLSFFGSRGARNEQDQIPGPSDRGQAHGPRVRAILPYTETHPYPTALSRRNHRFLIPTKGISSRPYTPTPKQAKRTSWIGNTGVGCELDWEHWMR